MDNASWRQTESYLRRLEIVWKEALLLFLLLLLLLYILLLVLLNLDHLLTLLLF